MTKTITLCTVVTFILIIGVYALAATNPVTSRIAFAVFMSVVPGIATLLLFGATRRARSTGRVVLVYVVAHVALQALLAVVR
jgi:hypothetical protein